MNPTLGGIYNPQEMRQTEFLARYSVRLELTLKLLQGILSSSPEEEPKHFVIQGLRGQGKTSLLRKLYLDLRENTETRDWLVPVLFKEELYGVTGLCRLWEEAGSLLQEHAALTGLVDKFEASWESPHYHKDCHLILDRALQRANVRLVLLIDNLGDLFAKLDRQEQQRLREILHTTKRIQIVGASTAMLEQHYDHGAPFYQFFRQVNLPGLDRDEALTLLRHLGTSQQQEQLEQVIAETPGRIETLRRLTAGVPRTLVLLFEILLDRDGNAFRDLELLLDRVTPLYKHRMDDLPPQQQSIVDAVALGWDAVSTREIARATRLPGKQVSAQLKQLQQANIIHKEPTSTKNHLYRLEERFFNIWYLMRHGRAGDRRRALWLVRFLDAWCTPQELRQRAERHLDMIANGQLQPEHAGLMTVALLGTDLDDATLHQLIEGTWDYIPIDLRNKFEHSVREQLEQKNEQYKLALKQAKQQLAQVKQFGELIQTKDYQQAVAIFEQLPNIENPDWIALGAFLYEQLKRYDDAKHLLNKAASQGDVEAMNELANLSQHHFKNTGDAMHWWRMAAEQGHVNAILQLTLRNIEQTHNVETTQSDLLNALPESEEHNIPSYLLMMAVVLFWDQKFPEGFAILEQALPGLDMEQESQGVSLVLTTLLAADQTAYMLRLFESDAFSAYRFRDHFKPFYYALLAKCGEPRADDFKRMGPELTETVAEIRNSVSTLRTRYFGDS